MAGNVDTRLQRLEEGRADALILASAGLDRLGKGAVITRRLEPDEMLGAPAQGALGIGCRADDEETQDFSAEDGRPRRRERPPVERTSLCNFLEGVSRARSVRERFPGEEAAGR